MRFKAQVKVKKCMQKGITEAKVINGLKSL